MKSKPSLPLGLLFAILGFVCISAYAVPTNAVEQAGFLGVEFHQASETQLRVGIVAEGSPAQKAGLMVGDLVSIMDGRLIRTFEDAQKVLTSRGEGDTVSITILRNNSRWTLFAVLTARPDILPLVLKTTAQPQPKAMGVTLSATPASPSEVRHEEPSKSNTSQKEGEGGWWLAIILIPLILVYICWTDQTGRFWPF